MEFMPKSLTTPESNLTYGKIVSYVLDQRSSRLTGIPSTSSFFQILLDSQIVISQLLTMVGYSKYCIDQFVMLISQNQNTESNQISFYVCLVIAVSAWCQTKANYK
jgi:hypothetical protein